MLRTDEGQRLDYLGDDFIFDTYFQSQKFLVVILTMLAMKALGDLPRHMLVMVKQYKSLFADQPSVEFRTLL